MNYPVIPLAQQIIQLCQQKGIANVVISPGSRNAPLTIGFAAHPEIQTYSIVDERCAAFFALGMAQQIQQPVAVVCTSGSAMLNYYPAIAEAFYSDIPLVIISADRPKHLIDVGDGQTIRQENIFDRHILYSANLEEGKDQFNTKEINQALNVALIDQGPVHINAPFSEPLYNTQSAFTTPVTLIEPRDVVEDTSDAVFNEFKEHWSQAKKKMVLIGVNTPNTVKQEYLDLLGN
ncbi:MAG: 2-succinyl-5-enolpyruvyl-6-hydroxy-3-cyclohexene-1-carboxylic-acid synthase, partial [Flavobacteriaceae bacterium]|nr:2-succinyl-5-enolpyruvyl-6-hydroxy-3-cyclohexene-1-carboxylic-acid synthase [Flavobacteriaceae bacterium]